MSQVEFAFFTRPVAGEMVPGIPTPTVPRVPVAASSSWTRPAIASSVAVVVVAGRRHAAAGELRPVVPERDRLDLRAAEVEPDPHARGFSSLPPPAFKARGGNRGNPARAARLRLAGPREALADRGRHA